jgi:hypothetical protein
MFLYDEGRPFAIHSTYFRLHEAPAPIAPEAQPAKTGDAPPGDFINKSDCRYQARGLGPAGFPFCFAGTGLW